MAIKKSDLYSSLWASCDELRGGMDASQYKDYVLFMLFIKYVSDKNGDSGEAEHVFRRESERHSGIIPNTIGASRRWQLDCAGKCSLSSRKTCPERTGGRMPLRRKG